MAMVTVAGVLAAVGLVTDSSVTVVASMLVSPLMGPILAVTFGFAIRDKGMIRRGLRNEAVGFLICVIIGMVAGYVDTYSFIYRLPLELDRSSWLNS